MMFTLVIIMVYVLCRVNVVLPARSSKLNTRVNVVESRVSTLEMRLAMETVQLKEDWVQVMDKLFELNQTVLESAGECDSRDKCPSQEKHFADAISDHDKAAMEGFKNEKRWVRDEISRLRKQMKLFEHNNALSDDLEIKMKKDLSQHKADILELIDQDKDRMKNNCAELENEFKMHFEKQQQSILELKKQHLDIKKEFEKQINDLKEATNSRPQKVSPCPDDWTSYGKFCYQFFPRDVTFNDARIECAKVSASIVDIQDMAENSFVVNLAGRKYFWIDQTNSGTQFTNWAPGSKPYEGNMETCVASFPSGSWYHVLCGGTVQVVVCKKPRQNI